MREAKYKAWIKDYAMIVDVKFLNLQNKEIIVTIEGEDYEFNCGEYNLMQYTGLKDKNGREIYEGDIVTWTYCLGTRVIPRDSHDEYIEGYKTEFYQVIFQDGAFKLFSKIHGTRYLRIPQSELAVIGNIYEHNHLLKG